MLVIRAAVREAVRECEEMAVYAQPIHELKIRQAFPWCFEESE